MPIVSITLKSKGPSSTPSQLQASGHASKEVKFTTDNPYAALVMDDDDGEDLAINEFDESANLFGNMGPSSSHTFSAG